MLKRVLVLMFQIFKYLCIIFVKNLVTSPSFLDLLLDRKQKKSPRVDFGQYPFKSVILLNGTKELGNLALDFERP